MAWGSDNFFKKKKKRKQRLKGRSETQTIIHQKDFRGHFNNYLWQDLSHIHYKIPKADFALSLILTDIQNGDFLSNAV